MIRPQGTGVAMQESLHLQVLGQLITGEQTGSFAKAFAHTTYAVGNLPTPTAMLVVRERSRPSLVRLATLGVLSRLLNSARTCSPGCRSQRNWDSWPSVAARDPQPSGRTSVAPSYIRYHTVMLVSSVSQYRTRLSKCVLGLTDIQQS